MYHLILLYLREGGHIRCRIGVMLAGDRKCQKTPTHASRNLWQSGGLAE